MLKNFYSVKDCKISQYHAPFIADDDVSATRLLTGAMIGEQTLLSQFPNDFELFQIGTFHTKTAKTTSLEAPIFIISCASIQLDLMRRAETNLSKSNDKDKTRQPNP